MSKRNVKTMSVEIGMSVMDEMIASNPDKVKEALARYDRANYKNKIECSADVPRAIKGKYKNSTQEHFLLLCLSLKNHVLDVIEIHRGGMDGVEIDMRTLFRAALGCEGCAHIIVAHNHPSGDPTPSPADIAITDRIAKAGEILGLALLDHVVFTKDSYNFTSLRDLGMVMG